MTVTYSTDDTPDLSSCLFKVVHLPSVKIGRFVLQKDSIRDFVKPFDVIIAYGDISWLKFSTLPWFNKRKVIFWTIGASASYAKRFDEHTEWDKIRAFFYKKASALIFYTDYPIQKYSRLGYSEEKMFVAPNTVAVRPLQSEMKRDIILFIGTLYRQKGLQTLLDSYHVLKGSCNLPQLVIIGSGPDYEDIKSWIATNGMSYFIKLVGPIYDIDEKAKFFARAIACISPCQAGLSVLESMGYGVPFITTKNAITGGEIFNIHNGVDGITMEKEDDLTNIIADISNNVEKYIQMGNRARDYYDNNRKPSDMAAGLWAAINYVLSTNE